MVADASKEASTPAAAEPVDAPAASGDHQHSPESVSPGDQPMNEGDLQTHDARGKPRTRHRRSNAVVLSGAEQQHCKY